MMSSNGFRHMSKASGIAAGISIQPYGVTIAVLDWRQELPRVLAVEHQPMPEGVAEQAVWQDRDAVSGAVNQCRQALGEPVTEAMLSLADAAVVTAKVALPRAWFSHQQHALARDMAAQLSPWHGQTLVVDWMRCDDGETSLALCPMQLAKDAQRCMQQAQLRLLAIEPESQCHWRLLRWLVPSAESVTARFVVCESRRLGVSVFVDGVLAASHNSVAAAVDHTQLPAFEQIVSVLRQLEPTVSAGDVILLCGSTADPKLCQSIQSLLGCRVMPFMSALTTAGIDFDRGKTALGLPPDAAVAIGNALWYQHARH